MNLSLFEGKLVSESVVLFFEAVDRLPEDSALGVEHLAVLSYFAFERFIFVPNSSILNG